MHTRSMGEGRVCRWCGDLIGERERMFVLAEGEAHELPGSAGRIPVGDCYHEVCYQVSAGRHPILRASRLYQ
jgi:hypothetical protein